MSNRSARHWSAKHTVAVPSSQSPASAAFCLSLLAMSTCPAARSAASYTRNGVSTEASASDRSYTSCVHNVLYQYPVQRAGWQPLFQVGNPSFKNYDTREGIELHHLHNFDP